MNKWMDGCESLTAVTIVGSYHKIMRNYVCTTEVGWLQRTE